jgi:hypothetical protein
MPALPKFNSAAASAADTAVAASTSSPERRGGQPLSEGRRKVTPAQREELLQVYLTSGQVAAEVLAKRYGVGKNYAAKLASERCYRPLYKPTPTNRVWRPA